MRILALTLSTIVTLSLYSQSIPRLMEKADELFQADRFLDAIEFYDKIVGIDKKNHFARYRLGFCYNRTLQYDKAKETFLQLGQEPNHEYRARGYYNYANILKLESDFELADSIFTFLISLPDVDEKLIELSRKQKEGCLLALRQEKVDKGYSVDPLGDLNSRFHDFGAVVNPSNKAVVFATTRNLPGLQYEGSQYKGLLPDLVAFERTDNGRFRSATNDQNFDRLNSQWAEGSGSFTKDGMKFYFSSCLGEKGTDCAIMVSNLIDGEWSAPVALNDYINESNAENKHPSISHTGDTLFFVSDRVGGFGGSDIWMSLRGMEEESWTPAINLGEIINSPENEITPYYSSPFNCLLFASNGHVGYGGYDIYAAKGESFFEPEIYNLGPPFNSALDDTYFAISDSVGFISTNRQDKRLLNLFSFDVPNEKLFLSLLISGESLIDARVVSKFRDVESLDLITFRVEDYQGYELFEPVKREKPKPPIIQTEEEKEEIAEQLIAAEGRNTDVGGILGGQGRRGEIPYEKLYFSYGSHKLRPEVLISLNDLVSQLQDQNYKSIEILAYTDNLGATSFNNTLSEKRGTAVREHLLSLGIPESKIRMLPRGELPPHGERDHWYSRVFNRRVEIIVETDDEIKLNTARSLLVRKESTSEQLASFLGVSKEDVINWNGKRKQPYEHGYVIRVFNPGIIPNLMYFLEERDLKHNIFAYELKDGETLQTVASKYNTMEELLYEINNFSEEPKAGDMVLIYQLNF